jgi:hypothetical protein
VSEFVSYLETTVGFVQLFKRLFVPTQKTVRALGSSAGSFCCCQKILEKEKGGGKFWKSRRGEENSGKVEGRRLLSTPQILQHP